MTEETNHTQRYLDALASLREVEPDKAIEAIGILLQEEHDWVIVLDERLKLAIEGLKYYKAQYHKTLAELEEITYACNEQSRELREKG